jgi:hypothetical protein
MKDRELFQFADTPQDAFQLLKTGLSDDLEATYERERVFHGERVPTTPAPDAQELLGPDIAKTR